MTTIATVPNTGYNGQSLNLTGTAFGGSPGKLYIIGATGTISQVTIDSWNDTSIVFFDTLPSYSFGAVGYIIETVAGTGAWSGPVGSTLWGVAPRSVDSALKVNDQVFGIGKGWDGETYITPSNFAGQQPRGVIFSASPPNYVVQFYDELGPSSLTFEVNGAEGTISPIREPLLSSLQALNPLPIQQ